MDVVWLTQAAAVWDLEFCVLTVAFHVYNWYRGLVKAGSFERDGAGTMGSFVLV